MKEFLESAEFNDYDKARFDKQVSLNSKRGNRDVIYRDDKRYNDYQGEKWLNVRSKDKKTLISAIIDGICDVSRDGYKAYSEIKNQEDLERAYNDNKRVVDQILRFLGKYMHGNITVYRGFNIEKDEYLKLRDQYGVRFDHQMLVYLNNRSKKFNSFSVSPFICKDFAESNTGVPVIIAGEAEPNDISFAFTAYLLGRHGSVREYELNINNLKDLKNLRIIKDIEAECKRVVESAPTIEDLQKQLDNGVKMEDLFDSVETKKEYDGTYYYGRSSIGDVIIKDNKILTPRSKEIEYLGDGVYSIMEMDTNKEVLYNTKTKAKSKQFKIIYHRGVDPDSKLVTASKGTNMMNLLNKQTCKELFNGTVKRISRLPGATWYGSPNIWHSVEFYLVQLNNGLFTLINDRGEVAFKVGPKTFKSIKNDDDEKLTLKCVDSSDKTRNYIIKNNNAIEMVG